MQNTETQTDTPVLERVNPNQPHQAASFFSSTDALRQSLDAGAYEVPAPQSLTSGYEDLLPSFSDVGGIASSTLSIDERIASASRVLAEMCGPTIAFNTYIAKLVGAAPAIEGTSSHVEPSPVAAVAPPSFNLAPATYLIGGSALTSMILSGVMGGSGDAGGLGSVAPPSSSQLVRAEDIVPSFPRLATRAILRADPESTVSSGDVQKSQLATQSEAPSVEGPAAAASSEVKAAESGAIAPVSPSKAAAPSEALVEDDEILIISDDGDDEVLIIDDEDHDEAAMTDEVAMTDDDVIIL